MRYLACFILFAALSGCAEVTLIKKADNAQEEKALSIRCVQWDACFLKADELCSNGYTVLDQSTSFGKKIEILCTEDQIEPRRSKKVQGNSISNDAQPSDTKKTAPRIEKNQSGEAVEKIMELKF